MRIQRLLILLLAAAAVAAAATAQTALDNLLYGTTYQERLGVVWVNNLDGQIVLLGKTYRPEAMHRVSINVTGKKAPDGSKKDAKVAFFGNSGHENRIEQLLVAEFPVTIRATFRVPERLPFQGKPVILQDAPAPGTSVGVFCTLTGEERTKCVAQDEGFLVVDRETCERLAEGSARLDSSACGDLPEVSPVADTLVLQRRDDEAPSP